MPTPLSEWQYFLMYFPLDKANWPFKAATNLTAPLILYYSGILPATPSLRHLFLVSQLKGTDTESSNNQSMPRPQILHQKATHDFTMLYASDRPPFLRELLFHFQISGSDITAKQLAYFLVEVCSSARDSSQPYLGDRQHQGFWSTLAQTKLSQLRVDHRVWADKESLNG